MFRSNSMYSHYTQQKLENPGPRDVYAWMIEAIDEAYQTSARDAGILILSQFGAVDQ